MALLPAECVAPVVGGVTFCGMLSGSTADGHDDAPAMRYDAPVMHDDAPAMHDDARAMHDDAHDHGPKRVVNETGIPAIIQFGIICWMYMYVHFTRARGSFCID